MRHCGPKNGRSRASFVNTLAADLIPRSYLRLVLFNVNISKILGD
jgi:hypothetical protein